MGWILSTPFFSHKKPHIKGRLPGMGQRVRSETLKSIIAQIVTER